MKINKFFIYIQNYLKIKVSKLYLYIYKFPQNLMLMALKNIITQFYKMIQSTSKKIFFLYLQFLRVLTFVLKDTLSIQKIHLKVDTFAEKFAIS